MFLGRGLVDVAFSAVLAPQVQSGVFHISELIPYILASKRQGMTEEASSKSGSVPLSRAAKVLAAVADRRAGAQLTEISKATGLPLSTIHRLVRNLVVVGFLEDRTGGTYRIGPAIRRLFHLAMDSADIEIICRPILEDLSRSVKQTSFVTRLRNNTLDTAASAMPSGSRGVLINPGTEFPIHATASGKIVFAHQSAAVVASALKVRRQKYRPKTLTTKEEVLAELERVRTAGFAESDDEFDEGVYAIAAPIQIARVGVIYSVGIVGLKSAVFDVVNRREIIALIKQAAKAIETRLTID